MACNISENVRGSRSIAAATQKEKKNLRKNNVIAEIRRINTNYLITRRDLKESILRQLAKKKTLSDEDVPESKLRRVLSSLDLTLLGIGSTLGVGIYVLAGKVARESAGPAVIISFLIAAVASAFAGFCYAEFGARVPKAGSAYAYCYYTMGEFIAFLIGWNLILEYIIGSASVTKAFSTYLDELTGNNMSQALREMLPINSEFLEDYPDFLAFAVVVVFAVCLALGLRNSSSINNVLTGINLFVVGFVIVAGGINAKIENWKISKEDVPSWGGEGGFAPFGISGIVKGAATCFYGFIGFDCIATTGEEAKSPRKSIPIAISVSLLTVFLTYFGISTVLTLMWPYYDQNVNAPLTSIFESIGWPVAKWIVSAGALFGLLPSLLGSLLPLPRIIYAMASDGLLFEILGRVNEKYQSPVIGTIISGVFTGLMAMLFNLSQLIDMMSIGTLLAYTIVAASVLLLRFRQSDVDVEVEESNDLSLKQRLYEQIFTRNRSKTPTKLSAAIVTVFVLLYCIVTLAAMSCVTFLEDKIAEKNWAVLLGLSLLIFISICLLVVISLQPKSKKKLYFMVPLIPVIPALSIACNIYLMLKLDFMTWVRFGIWIVIGVFIYFTNSLRNICTRRKMSVTLRERNLMK